MTVEGIFRTLFPYAFGRMITDIKHTFEDAAKEQVEIWKKEEIKAHEQGIKNIKQAHEEHIRKMRENWEFERKGMMEVAAAGRRQAYEEGKRDGKAESENPLRTYISFGDELMFPMDFMDYNSDEEREAIASIVRTQEWQQCFRHNILCQAMKKWRDARTQGDAQMMAIFNIVGNQFVELVEFYDNAPNIQQDASPKPNFNSLLEDE